VRAAARRSAVAGVESVRAAAGERVGERARAHGAVGRHLRRAHAPARHAGRRHAAALVAVRQLPVRGARVGVLPALRDARVDAPEVGHGRGGRARRVLGRRGGRRRAAVRHQGQHAGIRLNCSPSTLDLQHTPPTLRARRVLLFVTKGSMQVYDSTALRPPWTYSTLHPPSRLSAGRSLLEPPQPPRPTGLLCGWVAEPQVAGLQFAKPVPALDAHLLPLQLGEVQVRFCRYRFSPTGELKYRGAVGLGYRSTYKRTLLLIIRFY
jgi:hypothetical protein